MIAPLPTRPRHGFRLAACALALALTATAVCAGPAMATLEAVELLERPARYRLDADGWVVGPSPGGDVLRCADCEMPVQVQIDYGAMPDGGAAPDNASFLGRLRDDTAAHAFAMLMLQKALPPGIEFGISIEKTGFTTVGGLEAFEYVALIGDGEQTTQESAIVAIHRAQIVKVTLNHYEDSLDAAARQRIAALLQSIRFL